VIWPRVLLGTVADVQLGKMLSPKAKTGVSSFPYLRNVNVQWGRLDLVDVVEMDFDEDDRTKFALNRGDLLVCEGGEPGRCAVVDREMPGVFFQKALMRVRPRDGLVDTRFLQRFMEQAARRGTFAKDGNRATIAHFPAVKLNALEVPLPPLPEQRRIADILDKADAVRRKRKEAIALTEELLRSAFLEIFGDPVTNPKGWPVKPLGTFLSFITSGSRGWAEYYSDTGSRFIRSLDVQMDVISDEEPAFVVAPAGAEAERTRVSANDVLLTITGSKIGRAALVDDLHGGGYISQHVAILRLLPGLAPDVLTAFLVSGRGGQRLIAASQYGQTKPGLNLEQIRRFPVPVPTQDTQRQLRIARAAIRDARRRQAAALSQTDALFAALVEGAFRGEPAPPTSKRQVGSVLEPTSVETCMAVASVSGRAAIR